ncbi:threonylcarbamoyl-AMP synthase [Spirochaetia bacterium]|nr:threonylcarbamoyl-AMP synthase [Spirochaetia bacterium]
MQILTESDTDIAIAAEALKAGLLVAFPTETVYGLGADAFNVKALAAVFAAKNRPRFDPLIIHIAGLDSLDRITDLEALAPVLREKTEALAHSLWPGPLTLILPKKSEVPDLATAGLPTAAVRFPNHPVALRLIRASTGAIAAPSANPFGYLSPTRAEHVAQQLKDRVDYIIDGGRTGVGLESTVLDMTVSPLRILRPGGTTKEMIEKVIGPVSQNDPAALSITGPNSPGMLKSHYAPGTPLYLYESGTIIALPFVQNEGMLFYDGTTRNSWMKDNVPEAARTDPLSLSIWTLSETGNSAEAAANLFETLHIMDDAGLGAIHAQKAPHSAGGLEPAINDRLSRAAAISRRQKSP